MVKLIDVVNSGYCTYEIETNAAGANIYRRIGEQEFISWYMGDQRIERRGEIRRLFLYTVSSAEYARQLIVKGGLLHESAPRPV